MEEPIDVKWVDGPEDTGQINGSRCEHADFSWMLDEIEVDDDVDLRAVDNYSIETSIVKQGLSIGGDDVCDEKSSQTSILSLVYPLVNAWHKFTANVSRRQTHRLVLQYFWCLQCFFGEESVPPDIAAIFDKCFESQRDSNQPVNNTQNMMQDGGKPYVLSRPSYFESPSTKQLRKLLKLTLETLTVVLEVNARIQSKMQLDGCLITGTPEHLLCQNTYREIRCLVKRMERVSAILRKRLLVAVSDEIFSGTKVMYEPWFNEIDDIFLKDISFSSVAQLECVHVAGYEALIRLAACICYYSSLPEMSPSQCLRLRRITSDLTICVKEFQNGILSTVNKYDDVLKFSNKNSITTTNTYNQPSFSRESKVKRQCTTIINWADEFSEHTKAMKIVSSMLVQQSKDCDSEQYKLLVNELDQMEKVSVDQLQMLQALLNTQSVLIQDLRQKFVPAINDTCDVKETLESVKPTATPVLNEDVDQPIEFEADCVMDIGCREENELQSKDEVFLGMFCEDDKDSSSLNGEDFNENEKVAQKLYSGVVHQLKNALIPVKSKMQLREKEAVTKLFGDLQNTDANFFEEEESDDLNQDTIEITDVEARSSYMKNRRGNQKTSSYSNDSIDEDTDQEQGLTFFDRDFMKELQLKLSSVPSNHMLASGPVEEELTFELSTPEESEEEENH